MKTGIELIADERKRQVESEGFTSKHDDAHKKGQLSRAAACYADIESVQAARPYARYGIDELRLEVLEMWPWDEEWLKPDTDPVRNLVKAGALIAAEIDRLQRLCALQAAYQRLP